MQVHFLLAAFNQESRQRTNAEWVQMLDLRQIQDDFFRKAFLSVQQ